jgi:Endonuclease/Exonuclease/phosphatase family
MASKKALRFLWWNLQSFAHFEDGRRSEAQWPDTEEEYRAKLDRVERALHDLFGEDPPELLAFAEITNRAACHLRDLLVPKYHVFSLDQLTRASLQVAFIYDSSVSFEEKSPFVVGRVPRGTRPMAVIDHFSSGHCIRIFACHWTARFQETSEEVRSDLARDLNSEIYRFIHEETARGEARHVVILGDLNDEPFGVLETRMHASRDRSTARRAEHYSDKDFERVRLYNCAWRFLGERQPHSGKFQEGAAGTHYWDQKRSWHTFDHVIVTGSLLRETIPYLDEVHVRVATSPLIVGEKGRPQKFQWNNGNPEGVSDHLPVLGKIVLEREKTDAQF